MQWVTLKKLHARCTAIEEVFGRGTFAVDGNVLSDRVRLRLDLRLGMVAGSSRGTTEDFSCDSMSGGYARGEGNWGMSRFDISPRS